MRLAALMLVACSSQSTAPAPANRAEEEEPAMASAEACKRLLAHLVELEFRRAGSGTEAQKRGAAEAKEEEFVASCRKTPRERVVCALAAQDLDAVARCDTPP
ncbi:MAG: hypothetical protein KIT31_08660 [Deltaproteobacteria bacterium]|nr:hypothetical protein [Deltaproteobacteria bacterium]